MLRVQLKRDWFGPNNHLYTKSSSRFDLREVPTEFRDAMPKDAVVITEDNEPSPHPLKTGSVLDKKFDEAAHSREVFDQGLANAIAVAEAQGKAAKGPADIGFAENGGRAEVAAAAEKQNKAQVAGPVKDPELEAALARAGKNK